MCIRDSLEPLRTLIDGDLGGDVGDLTGQLGIGVPGGDLHHPGFVEHDRFERALNPLDRRFGCRRSSSRAANLEEVDDLRRHPDLRFFTPVDLLDTNSVHDLGSRLLGQCQVDQRVACLLYTSDAADERSSVDLGGRRIIKKKTHVQLRARTVIIT